MYIYRVNDCSGIAPSVATIGFFDGVHRGHQFLLNGVRELARQRGLASMAITFSVHPRKVLHESYMPQLLTTCDEKLTLLEKIGLDQTALLDFSQLLSQMTAREFMQKVISELLNVKVLVIGYDHRFGHNREEGFEQYVQYGKEMGLEVVQAQVCSIEHVNVSSSVVRSFLGEGYVDMANRCLGYEYAIEGRVVHGFQVGRKLGFPTANIQPEDADKMLPANGVYAVKVDVQGRKCFGMLNIGCRPTLNNGENVSIEVHIIDWNSEIYGEKIKVGFVKKIRDEQPFDNLLQLESQLKKDAEYVRFLFYS